MELSEKWSVHIPALPSLVQVCWTPINPLNTLCFLFIAGQCLSSIFSSGNRSILLCLDNSCLAVLSHVEVAVSQKPFLATTLSFLYTHLLHLTVDASLLTCVTSFRVFSAYKVPGWWYSYLHLTSTGIEPKRVKVIAQGYTATKCWSWNLNTGSLLWQLSPTHCSLSMWHSGLYQQT